VGSIKDRIAVVTITANRKNINNLPNFIRMGFLEKYFTAKITTQGVCLATKGEYILLSDIQDIFL